MEQGLQIIQGRARVAGGMSGKDCHIQSHPSTGDYLGWSKGCRSSGLEQGLQIIQGGARVAGGKDCHIQSHPSTGGHPG